VLDDKGNLSLLSMATLDLRPGFRYVIATVSREGVKTIEGKPLPMEKGDKAKTARTKATAKAHSI
jgi:hypothetical protein